MNYSIVSEIPAITLQEAKLYLRIDNNSEDALLSGLIAAAQNHCREAVGRIPYTATIDASYSNWTTQIELPFSTAASVAVYYIDATGVEQTVSSALYSLVDIDSVSTVVFKSTFTYPTVHESTPLPVRVRATYSNAAKENAAFKILVSSLVSYWYTNREPVTVGQTVAKLPLTFDALASSIRKGNFLV